MFDVLVHLIFDVLVHSAIGAVFLIWPFCICLAKFAVPISECTFDVRLTLHYVGTIPISFEETQVFLYIFLFDSPSSVQYTYIPI